MNKLNYKHYLYAVCFFILASIMGLWSWNTLSELFSLPHAQYKHALAAFLLLLVIKWSFSSKSHVFERMISEENRENLNH